MTPVATARFSRIRAAGLRNAQQPIGSFGEILGQAPLLVAHQEAAPAVPAKSTER